MKFDWRAARAAHPRLFVLIILLKVLRTKVGVVVAAGCVALMYYRRQLPLGFVQPIPWLLIGAALILVGLGFRLAALGCLRKKEELATGGIYSLCRHPLYLGSMVMAYGFCFLMGSVTTFIAATAYFLVFYPFTMVWEEIRLSERYGEAHEQFARTTPLILPIGRFRAAPYKFSQAMRKGGALQTGVTVLAVVAIYFMTEWMKRH